MDLRSIDPELYQTCNGRLRYWLATKLDAEDVDDCVNDTWLAVASAILKGQVTRPDRLESFIYTVGRRFAFGYIKQYSHRHCEIPFSSVPILGAGKNQEQKLITEQSLAISANLLRTFMPPRHRELIQRAYLGEESPEVTQQAMHLSATMYRVEKSRALRRFAALCKVNF